MLAVLAVIVITVQIKMFSGIGHETIKMKVQKGESVVLKCSSYEGVRTWSGPDVNNVGQRVKLYFSNNHKNPKLKLTEYSLQVNEGSYDLIIANFLEKNASSYICRFSKDGSFRETKYHVSLNGIGHETIKMKVQKGESVVLKCSNYEGIMSWSGPDVNNIEQRVELYFFKNHKNPKLNLTEYSLQVNEGSYDLIIANFLEKNTGSYICRFSKDGSFRETKYHVSLKEMTPNSTIMFDEGSKTNTSVDWETNTTQITEGEPNDFSVSHDIRTLIWALSAFFIFIMTTTYTVFVSSRVMRYSHVIHIVGPNVHMPSIPIYYSAPASENSRHVYDQSIPQYLEVIESEGQDYLSDSNEDESTDDIIIAVLDQSSHDYEEIQ